jgi:hypothetical protein
MDAGLVVDEQNTRRLAHGTLRSRQFWVRRIIAPVAQGCQMREPGYAEHTWRSIDQHLDKKTDDTPGVRWYDRQQVE